MSPSYLWKESMFTDVTWFVERVRPVNTVPHYMLRLRPRTDESGICYQFPGNIKSKVLGEWQFTRERFDQWYAGSGQGQIFDNDYLGGEQKHFDFRRTAFVDAIDKWVLGTGNKGGTPGSIVSPVAYGTFEKVSIPRDRVVLIFKINKNVVLDGVSELGIYITDPPPDVQVFAATFPDIFKHKGVELIVRIHIYRSKASMDLAEDPIVPVAC